MLILFVCVIPIIMTVIVVQTKHDFWYTKDDSMVATTVEPH